MTDRVFSIGQKHERTAADGGDLIVDMAFASEEPYERWWGIEKLVVSDKAVRLDRLNDGAPLLYNHDWSDLRGTHVPGSVKAESDGVLRGKVRITSATQTGRDTIALVESGVLTKASVGYQIHAIIEQTTGKGGEKVERHIDGAAFERLIESHSVVRNGRRMPGDLAAFHRALDAAVGSVLERAADEPTVYLVTDWEPIEDSLVTIPADNTVGVGRSAAGWVDPAAERAAYAEAIRAGLTTPVEAAATTEVIPQAADEPAAEPVPPQAAATTRSASMAEVLNPAASTAEHPDALAMEKQRKLAIQQLCKANRLDPRIEARWIEDGLPLTEVASEILRVLEERGKTNPQSAADLGLTPGEQRRYSLFRVLRLMSASNQVEAQRFQQDAAFEIECSRNVAKQLGREPDGFFVPADILRRPVDPEAARRAMASRTMTSIPGASGGFMVETENMGFVDILRNRSVLSNMGARTLSGLVGNVTIPRQTGAGTLVWQAGETTAATAADQTLGQLSMTPKTAIALTQIGRTLMLQSSPSAESMVMADLAQVVALGVDLAGIAGTGGAQPIGIINTSGITTGQDAATATYAKILGFQSAAAGVNAILDGAGYVTTPAVAALNMGRSRFANTDTPLWDGNILDGRMAGFRAMSSVQIPAGNMIFGSFGQVVIGEWGVLELTMNPYQNFGAGIVGIRAIYTVDVLLRYPQAFVLSTNAS